MSNLGRLAFYRNTMSSSSDSMSPSGQSPVTPMAGDCSPSESNGAATTAKSGTSSSTIVVKKSADGHIIMTTEVRGSGAAKKGTEKVVEERN